ncbi:MAG: Cro/Cl family transcriptional regulator [Nitrospira sp.]|jgi:transcriptional regulator with XRE-family HTH domain|nr:Cro/Cl family transcriptional regulator [Nitrospira sp.]
MSDTETLEMPTENRPEWRRRGEGPDPVDVHIGQRVRLSRKTHGLSQEALAAKIGVTFQQLQKYEKGVNRVSGSMLDRLSTVLDVPHSFFYDGLHSQREAGRVEEMSPNGIVTARSGLALMRHFDKCPPDVQASIVQFVKAVAGAL